MIPVSGSPAKVLIQRFGEAFERELFFTLVLLHMLYIFFTVFLTITQWRSGRKGAPFFLVKIFFRKEDLFP